MMEDKTETIKMFVICENCGKTMPKQTTGIEFLDSRTPSKVWCSERCLQEWEEKQV